MNGLGSKAVGIVAAVGIDRVKDANVAEWYVAGCYIETVAVLLLNRLVTGDMNVHVGIECLQHLSRQQVFLKGRNLHLRTTFTEGLDEGAATGRGVKHRPDLNTGLAKGLTQRVNDRLRGIEGRKDGVAHAAHMLDILFLILAVGPDYLKQLLHHRKERTVGLRPPLGTIDIVQDELQATKPTILA